MKTRHNLSAFLFGYAPSSSLLCSIEGGESGDGGAPPSHAPPAAPAPQPSATTITPDIQALLETAKQQAYNAGAADVRRAFEAKGKPNGGNTPPAATPAPASQHVDVSSEIARHRAFDRAVGKFDLSDKALGIIEAEFASSKPPDPTAWLSERADAFGWKRHGQTAASVTPSSTPASVPGAAPSGSPATGTNTGAPVTSNGAPSSPTAITDDTPILRLSPADQVALQQRIGVKAFTDRMMKEFREHGTRVRLR